MTVNPTHQGMEITILFLGYLTLLILLFGKFRENCLKLVNAYVRQNELQKYDDKKRIKMDVELSKLFPELTEQKDKKGKVTQEENCYFHTLMGGINRHLKPQVTS